MDKSLMEVAEEVRADILEAKEFFTTTEVLEYLKPFIIPPRTFQTWLKIGWIEGIKDGRHWKISRAVLEEQKHHMLEEYPHLAKEKSND